MVAKNSCTVVVGGGSRGLGKALWESLDIKNHEIILLHRGPSQSKSTNIYLDADSNQSIEDSLQKLLKYLSSNQPDQLDLHVILGGGMNVANDCTDIQQLERVYRHNVLIPSIFYREILELYRKAGNKSRINTFWYSSSVAVNTKGTWLYNSAKTSLEVLFKNMVLEYANHHNLFMIRIGVMNIKHKYFHQLLSKNPQEFNLRLERLVPSRHFTDPQEIYQLTVELKTSSSLCNGTIIDVSGGHSWM